MTPVAVFWQTEKAFKVNLMISIVSETVGPNLDGFFWIMLINNTIIVLLEHS